MFRLVGRLGNQCCSIPNVAMVAYCAFVLFSHFLRIQRLEIHASVGKHPLHLLLISPSPLHRLPHLLPSPPSSSLHAKPLPSTKRNKPYLSPKPSKTFSRLSQTLLDHNDSDIMRDWDQKRRRKKAEGELNEFNLNRVHLSFWFCLQSRQKSRLSLWNLVPLRDLGSFLMRFDSIWLNDWCLCCLWICTICTSHLFCWLCFDPGFDIACVSI